MNKFLKIFLVISLILIIGVSVCACDFGGQSKTYKIIYADDDGTHTILVSRGEVYQMESPSQRVGYEFLGLFDEEEGGTKYVSANGVSLKPFNGKSDLVLYPQFKAKQYIVELDYQGGTSSSGILELTIEYNQRIEGLPTDMELTGKAFDGWYTSAEGGEKVCESDGSLTTKSRLNNTNFDIENSDGIITLYARYVISNLTVKLYYDSSSTYEIVNVVYNTNLEDAVIFKDVNGKVVSAWSTKENDDELEYVFNGKIKSDMTLYAAQYSSYVAFDADNGSKIDVVAGEEGKVVNLPTPQRAGFEFICWRTLTADDVANSVTIGEIGVTYKAAWRAYTVNLNANGAAGVASQANVGSDGVAMLPVPSRTNYVFAGWFDESQTFYWNEITPMSNVNLTAKWLSSQVSSETNLWSDEYNASIPSGTLTANTYNSTKTKTVNLPVELQQAINEGKVKVTVTMRLKVWVRTKGNATATVKINATVNGTSKEGPTMTASGGGYDGLFNSHPVDGPMGDDVKSTLDFAFVAPNTGSFDVKLVYTMTSNKENSQVTTDVHFLCEELTVTVENVG